MRNEFIVSVDNIAFTAATAKTAISFIAPSGNDILIAEWSVMFLGVTPTDAPAKIELGYDLTGSTSPTATSYTPLRWNSSNTAITSSATDVEHSATVEGTYSPDVSHFYRVSPTSGLFVQYPLGSEFKVTPGAQFRMRITAAANVNASCHIRYSE